MDKFDLINTPLSGSNLIEADAGTGKTYAITGLFLRLILEKDLTADRILVVTFTKAATEELKDRIRNVLVLSKEGFEHGQSQDPLVQSIIQKYGKDERARGKVENALIDFDQAAIFTIHGFCNRILHEYTFETQSFYDAELISDETELIREITEDFWRIQFTGMPLEFISYAVEKGKIRKPQDFMNLIGKTRHPGIRIIPEMGKPEFTALKQYNKLLQELKQSWRKNRDTIMDLLQSSALNGNKYGGLNLSKKHPEITGRALKIVSLTRSMEQLVSDQDVGFPLFKGFEKLTASVLDQSIKKGFEPLSHPFFDLCDELFQAAARLENEMNQYILFLKTDLFRYSEAELRKRKKSNNIQFYDDLLTKLKTALFEEKNKGVNTLAKMIRNKYKAALVDEFQDTDQLQYDIFNHIFSNDDMVLFMIGDPKQSIYSFRGADIFSYMRAAESAESKFTLTDNYRTRPELISAVNTIFSNVKAPFLFKDIRFKPGKSGHVNQNYENDQLSGAPLKLWYVPSEGEKPLNKSEAVVKICGSTSSEIHDLINNKSIEPGDIAVLVRTNRQAEMMKIHLEKKRIPAVIHSTGNIFHSSESEEMERILQSIGEPFNEHRFRAAAVTDVIGIKGEHISALYDESSQENDRIRLESIRSRFMEYFMEWNNNGFIRMFYKFMNNEGVRERLLSMPDGERRFTNILHCSEILHKASLETTSTMKDLMKWFSQQRRPDSHGAEEHNLRLESDERAVKIITIHKSKGLEYPIVFCPFCWEGSKRASKELIFHDPDHNNQLTLDLNADQDSPHLMHAQNELLAENLRLLYVAVTRAKERCYLIWGSINKAQTSALAYLLHFIDQTGEKDGVYNVAESLEKHMKRLDDNDMLEDLKQLVNQSNRSIELSMMPESENGQFESHLDKNDNLSHRKFSGVIDNTFKILSYSSLVSRQHHQKEFPDYDSVPDSSSISASEPPDTQYQTVGKNIFSFPKGTRTGIFFHDVFEHLDFKSKRSAYEDLVIEKLKVYGYDLSWKKTVIRLIDNVLNANLVKGDNDLVLSNIPKEDRINEMEFYFPVNRLTPEKMKEVFSDLGNMNPFKESTAERDKLIFSPANGFLKGYIDLIIRRNDRYYIIDWKSNHLGSESENYNNNALSKVMSKHFYILQYHLYTLALHQYLKMKVSGYSYQNNFGGIFYIFIRGVHSGEDNQYGIFSDLPDPEIINKMGTALIPNY